MDGIMKRLTGIAPLFACALLFAAVGLIDCGGGGEGNPVNSGSGDGENNILGNNNCTSDATCKTVTIGTQTWMAENLNIETVDSWCYDTNQSNCAKYGRLYTWEAAMSACPLGWHLPTLEEWNVLAQAVGGDELWSDWHVWKVAGEKLKAKSGWNWNGYDDISGNGTDDYSFSALPGGLRYYFDGGFYYVGYGGNWWTATEYPDGRAYRWRMSYGYDDLGEYGSVKGYGFSVRCVLDGEGVE